MKQIVCDRCHKNIQKGYQLSGKSKNWWIFKSWSYWNFCNLCWDKAVGMESMTSEEMETRYKDLLKSGVVPL